MFEFEESIRHPLDRLRIAIEEQIDPVFGLDNLLLDDQRFALVLLNLRLETLDRQLGAAAGFLLHLGDLETLLLQLDGFTQRLEPYVERHQAVIILGDLRDQMRDEVVSSLARADVAMHRSVARIAKFSPDVELPGDV